MHRYFGFAIPTLQLFQHPENVKISIFPLHCPSRNAISSKVFNEFSKTFFGWKMRKVAIVVENFKCTDVLVLQYSVTTFPTSRKCINFNFSLYTVPAEMLYLQKYLTNFQKLFFGRTMRNVAIVVENFNCTEILVLQWQRYNFSNIWKM